MRLIYLLVLMWFIAAIGLYVFEKVVVVEPTVKSKPVGTIYDMKQKACKSYPTYKYCD